MDDRNEIWFEWEHVAGKHHTSLSYTTISITLSIQLLCGLSGWLFNKVAILWTEQIVKIDFIIFEPTSVYYSF